MKMNHKLLSLLITLGLALPLMSCANNEANSSTNQESSDVTSSESSDSSQSSQDEDGEFGITPRPNDFDECEDLLPSRDDFEDNTPTDDGELVDHIFQFEDLKITGNTHHNDHFCSNGYVFDPYFDGHIALECIGEGTTFTLQVTSDKAIKAPLDIKMNNNRTVGQPLGNAIAVTNNSKSLINTSVVIPSDGYICEYAPEGYFEMVTVTTTISLKAGVNKIKFAPHTDTNIDSFNIRTSAKLTVEDNKPNDLPSVRVIQPATENNDGVMEFVHNSFDCGNAIRRPLPKLSNDVYEKIEQEDGTLKYILNILGQKIDPTKINELPKPDLPGNYDNGDLVDHYFEFENAEIIGNSKDRKGNEQDHFCPSSAFVVAPEFYNNICLENILQSTTFKFTITSDQDFLVPFEVILGYYGNTGNSKLSELLNITNNGDAKDIDGRKVVGNAPEFTPNIGSLSMYFPMVRAIGTLHLHKGENVIAIKILVNGINLDAINIKTSANLTDSTNSTFTKETAPTFTVKTSPTQFAGGELEVKCNHIGCEAEARIISLSPLENTHYLKEESNDLITCYLMLFGNKVKIGSYDANSEPLPEAKDYFFEFENAKIEGNSKTGKVKNDHFCFTDSFVFSKDFSGFVCVENTTIGNVFEFNINSNIETSANFTLGIGTLGGSPLSAKFDVTNNGKSNLIYAEGGTSTQTTTPDVGDLSVWFNMIKVDGKITLQEGENVIRFVCKDYINLDYFKITTGAILKDNTVGQFSHTEIPTISVVTSPSQTNKGEVSGTCAHCNNSRNWPLPSLDSGIYQKENDGYYMTIYKQHIKVANL